MSLAVLEHVPHADHGVARAGALLRALVEGFLDGGDVLVRHVLAFSRVHELTRKIRLSVFILCIHRRLDVADHTSVLTSATRLLLVKVIESGLSSNGLSVVDGGIANDEVDVVFTLHAFTVDEEMEFTHSRDDDFFRLHVVLHNESWILSLEAIKSLQKVIQLIVLLGLNGQTHNRLRHVHRSHVKVVVSVTESLTRSAVHTKQCKNVARPRLRNILHLSGMHADHPGHFAFFARRRVGNSLSFFDFALVDADPSDLAKLRFFELEG